MRKYARESNRNRCLFMILYQTKMVVVNSNESSFVHPDPFGFLVMFGEMFNCKCFPF